MDLFEDSTWIAKPLTDLFVKHQLATEQDNKGLVCQRTPIGGYRARAQAYLSAYTIPAEFSGRALFGAHSKASQVKIVNVVVKDMPFLRNEWRERVKVAPDRNPVQTLHELDEFLGVMSEQLRLQVLLHGLDDSVDSRIALMNLYFARGTDRLINNHHSKLDDEVIKWLREGVKLEYILHFFSPSTLGGYDSDMKKPRVNLDEAKELDGVPIRQLRILYSNTD